MTWEDYIPKELIGLYDVYDFNHAAVILAKEFPGAFLDICTSLEGFRFTADDIIQSGGNKGPIVKKFEEILYKKGWKEKQLSAKLVVDDKKIRHDSHKVDFVKGRVAFDLEWNSKDQTFDRDLYAFRSFFEYGKISVGVLVTRSNKLDTMFKDLGQYTDRNGEIRHYKDKYGASTTHMNKLLPRLHSGRHGGCPILVFGITPALMEDNTND